MTAGASTWISIQLKEDEFEQMKQLMSSVFGGVEVYNLPGLSTFRIGEDNIIQLFGPGATHPQYLFNQGDIVMGFLVKDIQSSVDGLKTCGIEWLSDVYAAGHCLSFLYFKGPNGRIYALYEQKFNNDILQNFSNNLK